MEFRSYTLGELESHLTPMYHGPGVLVPISPARLTSYTHNPRAHPGDRVLFECLNNGRIIGFRTLLPDHFMDARGGVQKFAWLSGNYVDPVHRRKGISTRLLQMAEESWEGRFLYTNYAPGSRSVYEHTGRFPLLLERPGRRFYLRASLEELLVNRIGGRRLFRMSDRTINALRERKLVKYAGGAPFHGTIHRTGLNDPDLRDRIDNSMGSSLFSRDSKAMKWILDHPWLTEHPEGSFSYPFSYGTEKFRNLIYEFHSSGRDGGGWMWLLIHNRKVTVPYFRYDSDRVLEKMVIRILCTMVEENSATITVRYPDLAGGLEKYRRLFIARRNMPQMIFSHRELFPLIPSGKMVFDGDGDVAFTG